MCGADPGVAFGQAAAALNEVTRLEEIRADSSAENWEQLLTGLGTVVGSTARLADTLGDHLARATEQADWRDQAEHTGQHPDVLLADVAQSVAQISAQLAEAARTITAARDQVALLHLTTRNPGTGPHPAVGEKRV